MNKIQKVGFEEMSKFDALNPKVAAKVGEIGEDFLTIDFQGLMTTSGSTN